MTGVPEAAVKLAAETLAKNKPSLAVWCMGITQHHVGTANVRALCILQLALGNIGLNPDAARLAGRDRRRVEALRRGLGRRL